MQRYPRGLMVLGFSAAFLLALSSNDLTAKVTSQDQAKSTEAKAGDQTPAPKQIDIVTADKVELKAKLYPSAKKEAGCVIVLHTLGESSNNKELNNFAKKVQEKGLNVLLFDWRGHGDSTTVQPGMPSKNPQLVVKGFWDEQLNFQNVKGNTKRPSEIKYENFSTNYYPVLANDLAAIRAWLEEQPDINSSNLILVGLKDGATLGALWLNSEFHRFRYLAPGPGTPQGSLDRKNPEGLAVTGCVWISISPTLGASKTAVNVAAMLDVAGRMYKVPMLFIYGQGDDKGKQLATHCEKTLTGNDKKGYPYTAAKMIEGAEKASGKDLLLADKDTTARILDYLESLPTSKAAKMTKRTGEETYMWEYLNFRGAPERAAAKESGQKLLKFGGYHVFMK